MPPAKIARHALSDQLREIIASRGTAYSVARTADVDPGVIQRFLTGERGLTLATLDRLAEALGLRLVETGRRPTRPATRSKARRTTPSRPPGGPVGDDDQVEGITGAILPEPVGGDGAAEGVPIPAIPSV